MTLKVLKHEGRHDSNDLNRNHHLSKQAREKSIYDHDLILTMEEEYCLMRVDGRMLYLSSNRTSSMYSLSLSIMMSKRAKNIGVDDG